MAEKLKKEPDVYVFRLIKKNEVIRDADGLVLVQGEPEYPPYFSINNPCNVSFGGNRRKMRYLDGFKSLWVDEQPEKIDDGVLQSSLNTIVFSNGEARVNNDEKIKIEFLSNHPANAKSPYKIAGVIPLFELDDESVAALEELDLQDLRFDAMSKARGIKDDEMLVHAKVLGISYTEIDGQLSREMSSIKRDYRSFAEKNPKVYLETFEDPKTKISYWVKKAMEENLIDLATVPGQASWRKTKKIIAVIPQDKEAVDFLTNLTYTDAGVDFKKELQRLYDK